MPAAVVDEPEVPVVLAAAAVVPPRRSPRLVGSASKPPASVDGGSESFSSLSPSSSFQGSEGEEEEEEEEAEAEIDANGRKVKEAAKSFSRPGVRLTRHGLPDQRFHPRLGNRDVQVVSLKALRPRRPYKEVLPAWYLEVTKESKKHPISSYKDGDSVWSLVGDSRAKSSNVITTGNFRRLLYVAKQWYDQQEKRSSRNQDHTCCDLLFGKSTHTPYLVQGKATTECWTSSTR